MSFENCIINNDLLSKKQKEDLLKKYDATRARYMGTMSDWDAAVKAANDLIGTEVARMNEKKLNTLKDVMFRHQERAKWKINEGVWDSDIAKAGKLGPILFNKAEVHNARDVLERTSTIQTSLSNKYKRLLGEVVEKYRSKNAGLTQDHTGFLPIVRAAMGDPSVTGDAARMGKGMRDVFDQLHARLKSAGAVMGKIVNYFPQAHNAYLIKKMGFDAWRDLIYENIDIDKMIDVETGVPMTWGKLKTLMRPIYDSIITNGLNDLDDAVAKGIIKRGKGSSNFSERRSFSRFFHFKDAESFLAYNRIAGYGDEALFNMTMNHIDRMARDIAILENLGPKPENTFAELLQRAEAAKASNVATQTMKGLYDTLVGRNSYTGELPLAYRIVEGNQHLLRSNLLGAATISAISDVAFTAFTARMNGLSATKAIMQWFKLLNPASDVDRMIARQSLIVASAANGTSLKSARSADEAGKSGMLPFLASFTNRASGLGFVTDASRGGLPMETAGHLHILKMSNTQWADVEQGMKDGFKRWDMGETDFANIMRVDGTEMENGAKFIFPEDIYRAGFKDTAEKYEHWLTDMSLSASNEPRLMTRAITTGAVIGQAQRGSLNRAISSSVMMFKSFPITMTYNHLLPALRHAATSRGTDRLSRVASMLVVTTMLGALSIQSRQFLYGKTQRDMDDYKFWMAAAAQGGGGGIFGDFLFSDQSRFNRSFLSTMAGPVWGQIDDIARVFKGNFDKALDDGQESKFMSDIYQLARRNIPAVKLWYTRLLMERLLLDQGERMIDPLFDERMNRIESKMQRDTGQQFWWRPGDTTPR